MYCLAAASGGPSQEPAKYDGDHEVRRGSQVLAPQVLRRCAPCSCRRYRDDTPLRLLTSFDTATAGRIGPAQVHVVLFPVELAQVRAEAGTHLGGVVAQQPAHQAPRRVGGWCSP
jgi:hypothetical protein